MPTHNPHLEAARIVQDAGGELVGRIRLQKVAYLAQLAGFGDEFAFEYYHYGPYSEELAHGMDIAVALDLVKEEEKVAEWGGHYSIYRAPPSGAPASPARAEFLKTIKKINAVELELAATAAFLFAEEKCPDPWGETRVRKPQKAGQGRLEQAMAQYEKLRNLKTPHPLPELPPLAA